MNRDQITHDEIRILAAVTYEMANMPMAEPVVTARTKETDLMGRALHRVMCNREWRLPQMSDFAECLVRMAR